MESEPILRLLWGFVTSFIVTYVVVTFLVVPTKDITHSLPKIYISLFAAGWSVLLELIGDRFFDGKWYIRSITTIIIFLIIMAYVERKQVFVNDKQHLLALSEAISVGLQNTTLAYKNSSDPKNKKLLGEIMQYQTFYRDKIKDNLNNNN